MMIDAVLNCSSAIKICDTTIEHLNGGLLIKSGLSTLNIIKNPALLNWQSWVTSDFANSAVETQKNNASMFAVDYEKLAMLTIFLILALIVSLSLSLFNLYKCKEKIKKGHVIIDEVCHKLEQQSRFLRTQEQLLDRLRNQNSNLRHQQSALFAVINHELKNPLTAIKTNFVAWFRLASYDEVTLARARMVENSIERLEAFCVQAGSMHDLDEQSDSFVCLSQLLMSICDEYHAKHFDITGVSLDVKVDTNYSVKGNTSQLSGLIGNLLNCSVIRATPGSKIFIKLQATQNHLIVSLTEPDFSYPSKSATFIESAQQIEIERSPALFFASRIAQFLNVVITIRSDEIKGTVTTVTFPEFEVLAQGSQLKDESAPMLYFDYQQHPILESCGPSTNSKRCLVLDDDPQLQSCLGRMLSKHFNVKGVFDTETAIAEAQRWQPNLIITELQFAGSSIEAFNALAKMQASSDKSDAAVLILTTQDTVENRLKALDMNVSTFLTKPFSEELLIKTALHICSDKMANNELQSIKDNLPFQQSRDTIFLNQLNALVESNLDNVDFHFEDYFEQFSLSKRQFFRRVNALTRCTPRQYLINKRLELARHLLSKGVLLEKVTKNCGFRDAKTLTKLYQVHYGEEII